MSLYQMQINLIYLSMIAVDFKMICQIINKLRALNNKKKPQNFQSLINISCQKTKRKFFKSDRVKQINSKNKLIKIILNLLICKV